jgi:hypothetical protein
VCPGFYVDGLLAENGLTIIRDETRNQASNHTVVINAFGLQIQTKDKKLPKWISLESAQHHLPLHILRRQIITNKLVMKIMARSPRVEIAVGAGGEHFN